MSSPAAIKAVSHFTANGNSKKVSLISELAIGLTLGLGAGLWWKVRPSGSADTTASAEATSPRF